MAQTKDENGYKLPFPAMTPSQRLHLEVYGYCVVESTLTDDEVSQMLEAAQNVKSQFLTAGDPMKCKINGCYVAELKPDYISCCHLLEADPALFNYLTHPRIVALAEELAGGKVRLESSTAIINSREPDYDSDASYRYIFHRGGQPGFDSYTYGDLYHCTFAKTLTNLTELGPDDGGTTVIAGSHKLNCPEDEIIDAAYDDPSLIHQVVAPAGSTMVMCETLIHATGQVRSDRERVMLIGSYAHPKHQALVTCQPSPEFVDGLPEHLKELIAGKALWTWPERHRTLAMPAEMDDVPYKARMWSVEE